MVPDSLTRDAFLFAFPNNRKPFDARRTHMYRVHDILCLCLQRGDMDRARRAWCLLARCPEVKWMTLWSTAMFMLAGDYSDVRGRQQAKIDFLRAVMLQYSDDREAILKEIALCMILSGKHREALSELELYLPSFPYHDNPSLHILAGMISLYLAQSDIEGRTHFDRILVRDSQAHFERAIALNDKDDFAQAFLTKVRSRLHFTMQW
ncbi:hypothetical protein HGRIS_009394 [Hohenbuehelia grisea]|uniref:Uncharacterized protein n=1 Tax=Hohenbuehelia grisea TaxID=104357 RepID=A0ABR3J144_9AGAR